MDGQTKSSALDRVPQQDYHYFSAISVAAMPFECTAADSTSVMKASRGWDALDPSR